MTLPGERRLQAAAARPIVGLLRKRSVPIPPQSSISGSVRLRPKPAHRTFLSRQPCLAG